MPNARGSIAAGAKGGRAADEGDGRTGQDRTGQEDMALDYCRLGACGGPWTPLSLQQTWHR